MILDLLHSPAFWRSVKLAVFILLCRYAADGIMASASDETTATMARVERALVAAGFNGAVGYSELTPPPVELVDDLPGGDWGAYSIATGRVTISRRQPDGCKRITLAHELGHHAAHVKGLTVDIPTDAEAIKARMERISRIAEEAADADQFAPNCTKTRGSL